METFCVVKMKMYITNNTLILFLYILKESIYKLQRKNTNMFHGTILKLINRVKFNTTKDEFVISEIHSS